MHSPGFPLAPPSRARLNIVGRTSDRQVVSTLPGSSSGYSQSVKWMYSRIWTCCYNHRVIVNNTVNSRLPRFSLGAFLHAEIMKMSVSGAKTVPKSGKSYEDLCFAMFA